MVFGNVVQVIGDRLANVKGWVVAEGVEDGGGGVWVLHEGLELESPGESRAGAFAGEAADMLAGVSGPGVHDVEGAVEVLLDEWTDGEFS